MNRFYVWAVFTKDSQHETREYLIEALDAQNAMGHAWDELIEEKVPFSAILGMGIFNQTTGMVVDTSQLFHDRH